MAIPDVILDLQHATGPNRDIDRAITIIAGYKRTTVEKPGGKNKRLWTHPALDFYGVAPAFTERMEDAYQLTKLIFPEGAAAMSWSANGGTARLNDGPQFTAANPAIAMCMAVLSAKHFSEIAGNQHS